VKWISKYVMLASLPATVLGLPIAPAIGQSSAQQNSAQNSATLQNALRRIARNSNDSSALADAGLAALKLGDTRAAIGFLAKADQLYARSGRVKAGLARALLLEENPFGALRYFNEALANGVALRSIAVDRGLAYDLIGRNRDAQKDYELALRHGPSDLVLSRYAISLGISGDIAAADLKLNPLLQKSDRDAWRNRAFIFAMNGKSKDANQIARQTMQRRMAKAIKPFFARMPKLTAAQKAAAVHFGHFPASENIGVDVASVRYASNLAVRGGDGADAGLIPLGQPLGEDIKKPRVLAMPDVQPRRRPGSARSEKLSKRLSQRAKTNGIIPLAGRSLPAPSRARPLVKPAIEKPNEPVPQIAVRVKTGQSPISEKPGFETKIGVRTQSANVQMAAVNARMPSSLPIRPTSKTPLVSETVERKVAIAGRKPVTSVFTSSAPAGSQTAQISSAAVGAKLPITKPPKSQPVENKPIQFAAFDLAKSSAGSGKTSAPATIQFTQAAPSRKPLADIIKSISIPDAEKKTNIIPVDLDSITPAKVRSKPKPMPKIVKKPEEKKITVKHPKRYWVQIATGSNLSALEYDYRRMAKKHDGLFSGNSGWTSPWGRTRRLVVGPFDDLRAAKKFESGFRKGGGDGFAWVSSKGTEVNKLTK